MNHAGGKTRALNTMQRRLAAGDADVAIALIDLDPGSPQPRLLKEHGLRQGPRNTLYTVIGVGSRVAAIIAFSPYLEEWVATLCKSSREELDPQRLHRDPKRFEKA